MVTIAGVQFIREIWVIQPIKCPLLSSVKSAGMASWLDGRLGLPHTNICTIPESLDSITYTDAPRKIKMLPTYLLTEELYSSLFVLCRTNMVHSIMVWSTLFCARADKLIKIPSSQRHQTGVLLLKHTGLRRVV